jgi:N-sulfoglucosamine sulfohydrolase
VQSLPFLLRRAGYLTGIIGKVHVGPAAVYPWEVEISGKGLKGNRDVVAMAKAAREFIDQSGKKPFFLVMGYSDPHRAAKGFGNEPFAKDPAEVRYDPKKVLVPVHLPDQPEVRGELAEYYQAVTRMDRGVGLLMEVLQATGQLDNTLIIFVSDNGIPFPGAKTTLYAAGLHLPLIMAAPNQKQRGHSNNGLVSYIDLAPTILEWTGAKGPKYGLPGKSLLPILDEQTPKGRDVVFGSHTFHEITMYYPMRSIQTRTHKYIINLAHHLEYPFASDLWGSQTWEGIRKRNDEMLGQRLVSAYLKRPREELYDLTKDPHELKNLAGGALTPEHSQILADLRERLRVWQRETNDPWTILYREPDPKLP